MLNLESATSEKCQQFFPMTSSTEAKIAFSIEGFFFKICLTAVK